jgi:hypothetical protein
LLSKGPAIFVATLTALRHHITPLLFLLFILPTLRGQEFPVLRNSQGRNPLSQMGAGNLGSRFLRGGGSEAGQDSLKKRNKQEDSITIFYRLLQQPVSFLLDSTVDDQTRRFPLKATDLNLGNLGGASRSLLFAPANRPGFDAGFHAYDVYKLTVEEAPFFQTTRPYTELQYSLGSRIEQLLGLQHTQNINPRWNFFFHYRLINSPGFFQHQRSNHNNFLFTSKYQSKNLRYYSWLVLLSNKLQAEENGGMADTTAKILNDPIYKDRFNIPVQLGGADNFSANFFSTQIKTGSQYRLSSIVWRNQYDLGRKDSLVTDSTVIPLFFPRLRLEHQLRLDKEHYGFIDKIPAATYYRSFYNQTITAGDSVSLKDQWSRFTNEFSVYQFPDANNLRQYIKLGAALELINGSARGITRTFFNARGQFNYRNITKNKKWDLSLEGLLYLTGFNAGDYLAAAQLQRRLGKKQNSITLAGMNVNRNPSFIYDARSSFYLSSGPFRFNKENNTKLSAQLDLSTWGATLTGTYWLLNNFTYLTNFYQPKQTTALFTVFQVSLLKTIKISKTWKWHTELYWQQRVGAAPLNTLPFYWRNRVAYEGSLGFKNLNLATGLEWRYRSSYKADQYSPLLGQFFYQNNTTISNALPDIAYYVHFRIRPFTSFIRFENLNAAQSLDGFGFTRNNLVAPGYALNGLQIRVGIFWRFVN